MNNRRRKQFCDKSHLAFARLEGRQLLAADLVQPVLIPLQANVIETVLAEPENPTEDHESSTCTVRETENQTTQPNDCDLAGFHSNGFQVASADNSQKDVSGSGSSRVIDGDASDSVDSSEEGVALDGDPRGENNATTLFENPDLPESEVQIENEEDAPPQVLLDRSDKFVGIVQTDPGLTTISMASSIAPEFFVEVVPSQNPKFEYFSTDQSGLVEEPSVQKSWLVGARQDSNLSGLIASQQSFSVLSPGTQTPLEMKSSLMTIPASKTSHPTDALEKNAEFTTRFAEMLELYKSKFSDQVGLQKDLGLDSAMVEEFHSEATTSARLPSDEETHDAAISPLESSVQSTVIVAIAGGVYHYKDAGRRRRARASKSRRMLRYTQTHRRNRKA